MLKLHEKHKFSYNPEFVDNMFLENIFLWIIVFMGNFPLW